MSKEQENAAKGALLFEFEDAKHRVGLLRAEADKLAATFDGVADLLRTRPETMTPNADTMEEINSKIITLVADLKTSIAEAGRLRTRVQEAGLSYLIKD